jgi:hypothetical protein
LLAIRLAFSFGVLLTKLLFGIIIGMLGTLGRGILNNDIQGFVDGKCLDSIDGIELGPITASNLGDLASIAKDGRGLEVFRAIDFQNGKTRWILSLLLGGSKRGKIQSSILQWDTGSQKGDAHGLGTASASSK